MNMGLSRKFFQSALNLGSCIIMEIFEIIERSEGNIRLVLACLSGASALYAPK
jgi:hypothetical protein